MSKSIRILSTLLLITSFAALLHAQTGSERRVRVIGSLDRKPKPRLITTARKTKRTILLPKSVLENSKNNAANYEKEVFRLINSKRRSKGMPVLVFDENLSRLARSHSEDMATQGYFSHIDRDGNTVDGRAFLMGIDSWKAIGENIAFSKGVENPSSFTVNRWLMSKSHKRNLLSKTWVRSGVGVAVTKDGRYFFTQVFSR